LYAKKKEKEGEKRSSPVLKHTVVSKKPAVQRRVESAQEKSKGEKEGRGNAQRCQCFINCPKDQARKGRGAGRSESQLRADHSGDREGASITSTIAKEGQKKKKGRLEKGKHALKKDGLQHLIIVEKAREE